MILRFLIFFTVMCTVIFFTHFFLYKSHVNFIDIKDIRIKRGIIIFYVGISTLLILSMFVTRLVSNKFIDILYFMSSLWLGILTCLVLINTTNLLFFGIIKIFDLNINLKNLHFVFLGICLLISIYGVHNYYNIKYNIVEIGIKNLPKKWEDKNIILISDVHIGSFRGKKFISSFVEKINEKNPDIIFILGDLFDGIKLNVDEITDELSKLKANEKIYFIYGNHDNYTDSSDVYNIVTKSGFFILNDTTVLHDGVEIVGINHSNVHNNRIFAKIIVNQNNNPKFLLSHEPIRNVNLLESNEIDLQLAGHTHAGQFFPFTLITKAIYREMNYGLYDFGSFKNFTSSGLGAWGPAFRIFTHSEIVQLKFFKE